MIWFLWTHKSHVVLLLFSAGKHIPDTQRYVWPFEIRKRNSSNRKKQKNNISDWADSDYLEAPQKLRPTNDSGLQYLRICCIFTRQITFRFRFFFFILLLYFWLLADSGWMNVCGFYMAHAILYHASFRFFVVVVVFISGNHQAKRKKEKEKRKQHQILSPALPHASEPIHYLFSCFSMFSFDAHARAAVFYFIFFNTFFALEFSFIPIFIRLILYVCVCVFFSRVHTQLSYDISISVQVHTTYILCVHCARIYDEFTILLVCLFFFFFLLILVYFFPSHSPLYLRLSHACASTFSLWNPTKAEQMWCTAYFSPLNWSRMIKALRNLFCAHVVSPMLS